VDHASPVLLIQVSLTRISMLPRTPVGYIEAHAPYGDDVPAIGLGNVLKRDLGPPEFSFSNDSLQKLLMNGRALDPVS
jgi:hypothetical protein